MENEYVHGGYAAVLPNSCTRIFLALLVHCNSESQVAFPSIDTIQIFSGCTNRNTTIKAIKILQEYGIVGVIRTKDVFKMVNIYTFQAVRYWKPIPGWKEKMEKYNNKSQYQFKRHRSIKREEYRSSRDDTRTNLNENSPNNITNIKDVLRKKMQEMGMPIPGEAVAIQDPSRHSVVGPANKESLPVNTGKLREEVSANTVEIQTHRVGTNANTIDTRKYGKLTGTETHETYTPYVDNTTQKQREDDNIKSAYE